MRRVTTRREKDAFSDVALKQNMHAASIGANCWNYARKRNVRHVVRLLLLWFESDRKRKVDRLRSTFRCCRGYVTPPPEL